MKRIFDAIAAIRGAHAPSAKGAHRKSMWPLVSGDLLLGQPWYHTIELTPGVCTPGQNYGNIAVTRAILKNCEVEGRRCLDIGTMDGLVSVLLARRQAAEVFATDRYDRQDHIDIVQSALGVDLTYLPNASLGDVRQTLPGLTKKGALDLIVFSGVLYHMYDPMHGLALVRSMVRTGGLVVVETTAVVSRAMIGHFNAGGAIVNERHNYWNLSVTLLDYLLRYFRMSVLDCRYIDTGDMTEDGCKVIRLCAACRAANAPLPDAADQWMIAHRDDDADYRDWRSRYRNWRPWHDNSPLNYIGASKRFQRASGSVDLYQMVSATAPLTYEPSQITLSLGELY